MGAVAIHLGQRGGLVVPGKEKRGGQEGRRLERRGAAI